MTTQTTFTHYKSASDFRLGAGQMDYCPHKHHTAAAAAKCSWWNIYGAHPKHVAGWVTDGTHSVLS